MKYINWVEVTIRNKYGDQTTNFNSMNLVTKSLELSFCRDPKGVPRLVQAPNQEYEIRQGMESKRRFPNEITSPLDYFGGEVIGRVVPKHVHVVEEVTAL